MANNLPMKIASIGTAAAMTSIDLVRFLLDQLRQQHAGEQDGEDEQDRLAGARGERAGRDQRPGRAFGQRDRQRLAAGRRRGAVAAGLVDEERQLPDGPPVGADRAGEMRRVEPAVEHAEHRRTLLRQQVGALGGEVGCRGDRGSSTTAAFSPSSGRHRRAGCVERAIVGGAADHRDHRPLRIALDA